MCYSYSVGDSYGPLAIGSFAQGFIPRDPSIVHTKPKIDTQPVPTAKLILPGSKTLGRPPTDYDSIAKDGYSDCVVVFGCVDEISSAASEPMLVAEEYDPANPKEAGTPLPFDHDLSIMLRQPNPQVVSDTEFREEAVTTMKIGGEAIILKNRSHGIPKELWNLKPSLVKADPLKSGRIRAYLYGSGQNIDEYDPEDIIHIKSYNPNDPYRGFSPLAVVMAEAKLDSEAIRYLLTYFVNGAIPQLALFVKGQPTPGERLALATDWRETYGQEHRFKEVAVFGEGASVETIGVDPAKLELANIFRETGIRICLALRIPPSIIGVRLGIEKSIFNNMSEAQRRFREGMVPFFKRLDRAFTNRLAADFGPNIRIRHDLSTVHALEEDRRENEKSSALLYRAGVISRAESRRRIGMTPEPPEPNPVFVEKPGPPVSGAERASEALPQADDGDNLVEFGDRRALLT